MRGRCRPLDDQIAAEQMHSNALLRQLLYHGGNAGCRCAGAQARVMPEPRSHTLMTNSVSLTRVDELDIGPLRKQRMILDGRTIGIYGEFRYILIRKITACGLPIERRMWL